MRSAVSCLPPRHPPGEGSLKAGHSEEQERCRLPRTARREPGCHNLHIHHRFFFRVTTRAGTSIFQS